MSIEFLKHAMYVDCIISLKKIDTNSTMYVHVSVEESEYHIINDDTYEEITDYENYTVLDDLSNEYSLCDQCNVNHATKAKRSLVYCDNCISLNEICNGVYKFYNKKELINILKAFHIDEKISNKKDKGIAVLNSVGDFDDYDITIIGADEIGEF